MRQTSVYGAVFNSEWIQGSWTPDDLKLSISYRELFAIVAAALTWGAEWSGRRIVFVTDNKPITQIWNTGTSPCPDIMSLIRPLYSHAARHGYTVSFKHIFGSSNPIADALSRFQMDKFFSLMPHANPAPNILPPTLINLRARTG